MVQANRYSCKLNEYILAFTRHDSKSLDVLECPHLSVIHLPPIGASEQVEDFF